MYADILFLVNFSMDYLSLYITGKILHRRMTLVRTMISSTIGGIYGVLAAVSGISGFFQIISGIAVSVLMCVISFTSETVYEKFLPKFKICAVFWCVSAILGGIMTAVYSFFNTSIGDISSAAKGSITKTKDTIGLSRFIGLAVISGIIVISAVKIFSSSPVTSGKSVTLTVLLNKKSVQFNALTDSGNLLTDPVSGRPVIVASADAVRDLFDEKTFEILKNGDVSKLTEADRSLRNRLRLIPKNTLNENKILTGFVPDSLIITNGNESKERDAVIAVTDASKNHFGGLSATVPTSILR